MPVPKPRDGEEKDEFISRCMGDQAMQEFEQEQRAAVCFQTWKDKDKNMKHRAYSVWHIKEVNSEKRIIEGIATTPTPDRMQDIVEIDGINFKLPLPLLNQHESHQPLGHIIAAKKTSEGLWIRGQIAKAGILKYIDDAWEQIKAGLVTGLSIGFQGLEHAFIKETGGIRYIKSELYEISAVTIPANAEASILTVKSCDLAALAASGKKSAQVVRLDPPSISPGASGFTKGKHMTIQEQIAALEAKRSAHDGRMETLTNKAADEGRTFEENEKEEFNNLDGEVKAIDEHLTILRKRAERLAATATAVTPANTATVDKAADTRRGVIQVTSNAPKGIGVARMAICMVKAQNNPHYAMQLARENYPDMPGVELLIKTAIDAGDTTTSGWASQLVPAAQQQADEFLELLRPATILGRIPGIRRVPFNIAVPIETASGTVQWVGEGAPKPVTKLTLSSITLTWAKAAAIVVITRELAKFSRPDAEMVVRDSMVKTLVRFFDTAFISTTAAVTNVAPAGILNSISAVTPSGATAAAFRTDFANILDNMTVNNVPLSQVVVLMSATQAVRLSLMVTDLGVQLFPNITREGGTILGFPAIVSENVGTKIIVMNAGDIFLAQDPGVEVSVSDQASVEMDSEPLQGEQSPLTNIGPLKSFWQNNLIGIRVEQFTTWARARTSAVEYLSPVAYVP